MHRGPLPNRRSASRLARSITKVAAESRGNVSTLRLAAAERPPMIARCLTLRAATALTIAVSFVATTRGDDCLRRLGLGFSAGYHAPVTCPTPSCHQKLGVWHGWKQACTLPNARQLGGDCDCAPCAPAAPCPPCAPCFPASPCGCGQFGLPSIAPGFGLRGLPIGGGCSTCPGGYGQPSRAPLMFN